MLKGFIVNIKLFINIQKISKKVVKVAKEARFFCENCNKEVENNARFCKYCGKFFVSVRCPECGKVGNHNDFVNGCPRCGYAQKQKNELREQIILRRYKRERRLSDALPSWIYIFIILILIGFIICIFTYL